MQAKRSVPEGLFDTELHTMCLGGVTHGRKDARDEGLRRGQVVTHTQDFPRSGEKHFLMRNQSGQAHRVDRHGRT